MTRWEKINCSSTTMETHELESHRRWKFFEKNPRSRTKSHQTCRTRNGGAIYHCTNAVTPSLRNQRTSTSSHGNLASSNQQPKPFYASFPGPYISCSPKFEWLHVQEKLIPKCIMDSGLIEHSSGPQNREAADVPEGQQGSSRRLM